MQVNQFVNAFFLSNTFVLSETNTNSVWLIDVGAIDKVLDFLNPCQSIEGVFLTHYHYDHIAGLNRLIDNFPNCIIYASAYTIDCLYQPKLNFSYYHEDPIICNSNKTIEIFSIEQLNLWNCFKVDAIQTPGHTPGCVSFLICNYFFTGDSYIPHKKVVTKLKGGNREQAKRSLQRMKSILSPTTIICPGHGNMTQTNECISHIQKLAFDC